MTTIKCTIIWDDGPRQVYTLTCVPVPSFINLLKATIPASQRTYDPQTKIWCFSEEWGPKIAVAATGFFEQNQIKFTSKEVVQRKNKSNIPAGTDVNKLPMTDVIAGFIKLLSKNALKSAYRTAAMELHPDRQGGDQSKMAQLNTLWTRIEAELK